MLRLNSLYYQICRYVQHAITPPAQPDFKIIYRLPYIREIGLINRIKFYHTAGSSIAVPGVMLLNHLQMCTIDDFMLASFLSIAGIVPLYGLGYFTNKLVGIVYYNEQKNSIKLAYINFWGNRKDLEVEVNDIVPFCDQTASYTDALYLKLKRYSSKDVMKLCTKFGAILDMKHFNQVFSS